MKKKFEIDDEVVCFAGYGKVVEITDYSLSIKVYIEDKKTFVLFTHDGRYNQYDEFPTLFHVENKPEQWKREVEREVKSYVIVNNKDNTIDSYFRHYEDATKMVSMNQTVVELKGSYITEEF